MAKQLFGNNASSLLAASISDTDLTIQVANGFGSLYPNPGVDEYFLVTIENDNGDIEIVKVTARAADLLTVPPGGRGQEGTTAQAWTNGQARVELRLTRGTMETFIQRGGDVMSGDLDMDGNDLIDAKLTGASTQILAGEIVDVPLRGNAGDSSNEVRVPADGTRATAGGSAILVEGDTQRVAQAAFVVGQVILWYGSQANIPPGWHICDGTNGTPDLRDRFVVGAGSTYALGATGGAAQAPASNTGSSGSHTHGGETGDAAPEGVPAHTHSLYIKGSANTDDQVTGRSDSQAWGLAFAKTSEGAGAFGLYATNRVGTPLVGKGGDGDGMHSHSISADGAHTHTIPAINTLPPYRALFYIMFVGF